jgi:hypothetical protein
MTPEHDQYNTNTVMRGRNYALESKIFCHFAAIGASEGLVSGTQVVLQWHASGLLKT